MVSHPFDSPEPSTPFETEAVKQPIRRVLLFCGARPGTDPADAALAAAVGRVLANNGVGLVYGGGALGLMGEAGRAALAAGGAVEGIIPRFLKDWEVSEPLCHDMTVTHGEATASLHVRKALMFDRSDAVLALPGGLGTLDELIEVLSWRNLRLHQKPIWLMGGRGHWDPFLALLDHLVARGFAGKDMPGWVQQIDGTDALAAHLCAP